MNVFEVIAIIVFLICLNWLNTPEKGLKISKTLLDYDRYMYYDLKELCMPISRKKSNFFER